MKFRGCAPAYLEYASDMLANRNYRMMNLAERGLLDTLRRECWVAGSIPAYLPDMTRVLGLPEDQVRDAFTQRVKAFFKESGTDLIATDLESYRAKLSERKARMAEGGRAGGKKTQQRNRSKSAEASLEGSLEAKLKPLKGKEWNGKERKGLSIGRGGSSEGIDADFVAAYNQSETTMNGVPT